MVPSPRVVDNLLDMTRLQSGHLELNLEWCNVSELIDQSMKRVAKELANRDLVIDMAIGFLAACCVLVVLIYLAGWR